MTRTCGMCGTHKASEKEWCDACARLHARIAGGVLAAIVGYDGPQGGARNLAARAIELTDALFDELSPTKGKDEPSAGRMHAPHPAEPVHVHPECGRTLTCADAKMKCGLTLREAKAYTFDPEGVTCPECRAQA